MNDLNGLLLVDKPLEWTSFDVVAKVRGHLRRHTGQKKIKVGHTGTLDPLATGLLVLTIGSYCKRAAEFSKLDKSYRAEVYLGEVSSTDDQEGEKTVVSDLQPSQDQIEAAITKFSGEQQQLPPAFSAIKVNGQRAYKLARQGSAVELKSRTITVHSIDQIEYNYPKLSFVTEVSSGTYIRSLARDLGQALGTGAYLSGLERLTVGQFQLDQAVTVDQIMNSDPANLLISAEAPREAE